MNFAGDINEVSSIIKQTDDIHPKYFFATLLPTAVKE
jgi:hypothetical protein